MKNGHCPKCNSQDVYVSLNGGGIGEGFSIRVRDGDSLKPTREWETFLCATCGYFENYLRDKDMIERIVEDPEAARWKKVS